MNTDEGVPFRSVFNFVRLQYIINDLASARILERDNILPLGNLWLRLMPFRHKSASFFSCVVILTSVSCVYVLYVPDWLTSVYKNQWFAMLRTEFENDNG